MSISLQTPESLAIAARDRAEIAEDLDRFAMSDAAKTTDLIRAGLSHALPQEAANRIATVASNVSRGKPAGNALEGYRLAHTQDGKYLLVNPAERLPEGTMDSIDLDAVTETAACGINRARLQCAADGTGVADYLEPLYWQRQPMARVKRTMDRLKEDQKTQDAANAAIRSGAAWRAEATVNYLRATFPRLTDADAKVARDAIMAGRSEDGFVSTEMLKHPNGSTTMLASVGVFPAQRPPAGAYRSATLSQIADHLSKAEAQFPGMAHDHVAVSVSMRKSCPLGEGCWPTPSDSDQDNS